ncbi:hypothetical protein V5O48_003039 [Marasmius crinis-equi]|uniref:Uncharacterized protein n=1 Tax=Marasmius crinis-equi TaxID=585013 RepID=A0ABR3FTY9_9AGAR
MDYPENDTPPCQENPSGQDSADLTQASPAAATVQPVPQQPDCLMISLDDLPDLRIDQQKRKLGPVSDSFFESTKDWAARLQTEDIDRESEEYQFVLRNTKHLDKFVAPQAINATSSKKFRLEDDLNLRKDAALGSGPLQDDELVAALLAQKGVMRSTLLFLPQPRKGRTSTRKILSADLCRRGRPEADPMPMGLVAQLIMKNSKNPTYSPSTSCPEGCDFYAAGLEQVFDHLLFQCTQKAKYQAMHQGYLPRAERGATGRYDDPGNRDLTTIDQAVAHFPLLSRQSAAEEFDCGFDFKLSEEAGVVAEVKKMWIDEVEFTIGSNLASLLRRKEALMSKP